MKICVKARLKEHKPGPVTMASKGIFKGIHLQTQGGKKKVTKFGSTWMSDPHRRVQGDSQPDVEGRPSKKGKKSV